MRILFTKIYANRYLGQSLLRKLLAIILLINLFSVGYNQAIRGTILEKGTELSIPNATIYFSGTFIGTTSDENGDFEIDISKNASRPLTFSAIGYYSMAISGLSQDKHLEVYLTPKAYEMEEVIITSESYERERKVNLKLFKKEFLGSTSNSRNCEILNEDDISFNYGSDKDTLRAFALKPIQIFNTSLGYKITYYLDIFEYTRKSNSLFFTGSIIFTKDLATNARNKKFYERKRKKAYMGSRMHFFRTLWSDDLKSSRFAVKDSSDNKIKYREITLDDGSISQIKSKEKYLKHKDIVIQTDTDNTFLSYSENLIVYYYTRVSQINFLKEKVFFDQDGFFDPTGISWVGVMGNQRIADWLPYEYVAE